MAKVAVILEDYFEDVEYTGPVNAFREQGHELVVIGLEKGKTVKGKKEHTPVVINTNIDDAQVDAFDALLIPGGYSPDRLRAHHNAVEFVRTFMESNKPVFVICHGPQLLITAQVLQGRKVTGWKSIIQDIKNARAEFIDKEVVVDGNLVSSRTPSDLPAFIREALKLIS